MVASSSLMYWRSPSTPRIRVYSWERRPPSLPRRDRMVASEAPTTSSIAADPCLATSAAAAAGDDDFGIYVRS